MKLAIFYDKLWLSRYVTHDESIKAVQRIIAQTQGVFGWPSLITPIVLRVKSVGYIDAEMPVTGQGM
jgi:hypothetical protein